MQELRPITPDEFEPWLRAESRAHSNRLDHDPNELRPHFDLSRSIAVLENGQIIGGCHSHQLQMSIPGGTSIVAGVANVAVQPTHTRQGVMTRMMQRQINDIHQRGEPLAALFASESLIYGRFGYGVATLQESWRIDRPHTAYNRQHNPPGRITFIDPADIPQLLPQVFQRSTTGRAGVFQRQPHEWQRDARNPEHQQGGRGGLFYAAYQQDHQIDGYVIYRANRPTLTVNELMAATPQAAAALWRFCFDIDLMSATEAVKRPLDDPLPWMLADPRRLQRTTRDALWLRIIDVPAALTQRQYPHPAHLTLEIRDQQCPWNNRRFTLEATPEGATCQPTTTQTPDLTLDASALASAYLGAINFTTLKNAGQVDEHTPGSLQQANQLFATTPAPWTPFNF